MKRALSIAMVAAALGWSQPALAQEPTAISPASEAVVRSALTEQLVKLGLTEPEAQSRVAKLPYAEIRQLVENPKQLGMGGIQDRTLIIIALILIVPSVLLLLIAI